MSRHLVASRRLPAAGVDKVIFSSSCATYGVPRTLPIDEATPQIPINPYGRTKLIAEHMLADYAAAYGLRYVALRYFNACGADPDGELGEWHDPETHLIPRALLAAAGRISHLTIFGDDYETADGTCVRDYIHVTDLARAHVLAFGISKGRRKPGCQFGHRERIFGQGGPGRRQPGLRAAQVPIDSHPRRAGDPPTLYADASLARQVPRVSAEYSDLDTIVRTAAPFFGLEARCVTRHCASRTEACRP